ncbi:hypothetical protein ACH5RR_003686 [Cinchona calisaya]|uniref:F-box protein At3g26010-like beta-propeller domain-containing protein n=1 Tax=Cinchona calisaya TaxID=153742 RepID=A0ABD3AVF8_9GENT
MGVRASGLAAERLRSSLDSREIAAAKMDLEEGGIILVGAVTLTTHKRLWNAVAPIKRGTNSIYIAGMHSSRESGKGVVPKSDSGLALRQGFMTRVKDSVVTKYKVIRVEDNVWKISVLKFEIFSSETGEWRDVDIHFEQVQLNESLHFVDRKFGIFAYNPYKDPNSCRVKKLSRDIDTEYYHSADGKTRLFDIHQGYLRYFEVSHDSNSI